MTRKRRKLVTCCLAGVVLLVSGLFWLCCLSESAFLKEAPYDVELPESPELHARLYLYDGQRYILVVSIPGTSTTRGFIVDIAAKKVGIPNFPSYTRFGKFALVDKMTLLGYPELWGERIANFETSGENWVIRITGDVSDPEFTDPRTKAYLEEDLIYNKRVVLRPRLKNTHARQGVESAI